MNLSDNTILITGGTSGIGLELAKILAAQNKVIICGMLQAETQKAAGSIPGVYGFHCDISSEKELLRMVKSLSYNFVDLDVIIHADLRPGIAAFVAMELFGMFVPLLSVQPEAVVVNIADQSMMNEISFEVKEFLKDNGITAFEIQLLFNIADLSPKRCVEIARQIKNELEGDLFLTRLSIPRDI